jgi:hypothetical protein
MPSNQLQKLSAKKSSYAIHLAWLTTNLAWPKKPGRPESGCYQPLANEDGFVLVSAIILLLILVMLGISSNMTTNLETQISGNDKIAKQTFYAADGGSEVGANLLEENIACAEGFAVQPLTIGTVQVVNKDFWLQEDSNFWTLDGAGGRISALTAFPSDAVRDIRFPVNDALPHTNLSIYGNTVLTQGSGLQMISGYRGKGKGAAGGGGQIIYDVYSQRQGESNSQSIILLQWRHIIGLEGNCNY